MPVDSPHDFPLVISSMPPTRQQQVAASAAAIILLVIAVLVAPFAHLQLARLDVFVPVLQTVLSLVDLLTAILLFAQYAIQPHRALLAVGSAYIFSGAMAFLQTLTFPGGYGPAGVIGDGNNSPAWFFVLWHTTFPLCIMAYAFLKDEKPASRIAPAKSLAMTICGVVAAIAVLAWLVTANVALLPPFYTGSITQQTRLGNQINVALCLLGAITLAVLFVRRRTILDLWLMVTLLAWIPNFLVAAVASSVRFSLGWYAARGFALVASSLLLSVLLTETALLYSRLASALTMLRRERGNRLMSIDAATAAIAHEIRSPLASIPLNVEAARLQLGMEPPDVANVDVILQDIETASLRVNATISSVRELFKGSVTVTTAIHVETVALQVLRLLEHELQLHKIQVAANFFTPGHYVHADPTQVQQVILNLVKNAIEAMSPASGRRELTLSSRSERGSALLIVQDTGPGVAPADQERIFEPFFTTRPNGMGLGLAVCRTLLERAGGKLVLARSGPEGSIFEVSLPLAKNEHSASKHNAGRTLEAHRTRENAETTQIKQ
ncbi:MASE4 domain-containing protein [Bradyrhizobium diazoefficiens]|nr:MASE4 domain-containing protein [Bradyrhizobium diazoefficiens]MBR0811038.1 MASE4 domain-containing protein [Bradyrhizobium diazoefficiens]